MRDTADYCSSTASGEVESEEPLLSPSHCHSMSSSEIVNNCAICSSRRQRHKLVWAVFLVWTAPLALAVGRSYGLWGSEPQSATQQPDGQLRLVQVVFRHGARTPLSNLYWPNSSTWTHCSHHPLQSDGTAGALASPNSRNTRSNNNKGNSITLKLYDPSGAKTPPALSGDEEPQLPGGCRMGSLTDQGFQNAIDLGTQLRQRYIDQDKLLPAGKIDLRLLHAESTAVQRTVTTLRGVLNGLYPNSSSAVVVPVAVRQHEQEFMSADWDGCGALGNVTRQLAQVQQERDASDPMLEEFEHQVRSGLQLPDEVPLLWNRLRDEVACMEAEGQTPPAAAAQSHLLAHIDYLATQRRVETAAPEAGDCLLGRDHEEQCQSVTALTTGRLLHQLVHNMLAAATRSSSSNSTQPGHTNSTSKATKHVRQSTSTTRRLLAQRLAAQAEPSHGPRSSTSEDDDDGSEPGLEANGPRLMLYSAHDTTLLPLLTALGQHQTTWPGFASHIAFELWQHKGEHHVRVLHDGEALRLPLAPKNSNLKQLAEVRLVLNRLSSRSKGWVDGCWRQLLSNLPKWFGGNGGAGSVTTVRGEDSAGSAHSLATGSRSAPAAAEERLASNGQGVYTESQYVVGLQDFRQRVVQDYTLSPSEYAKACGASTTDTAHAAAKQWRAQFY